MSRPPAAQECNTLIEPVVQIQYLRRERPVVEMVEMAWTITEIAF
jgi:hypothetical protein